MTDSSSDGTAGNISKALTSTSIYAASSPTLSPLVAPPAWSNQSRPDGHNTVATPTLYSDDWGLFLSIPLLPSHPQGLKYPISLFDEEMANGTFTIQKYGLDIDFTQSQLAHSHHQLPQIDWVSNQEPPLLDNNQATTPVRIVNSKNYFH